MGTIKTDINKLLEEASLVIQELEYDLRQHNYHSSSPGSAKRVRNDFEKVILNYNIYCEPK